MITLWRRSWIGLPLVVVALYALSLLSSRDVTGESTPYSPHGELKLDCRTCHSPSGWKPPVIAKEFDHGKVSQWSLVGAHKAVACSACHRSPVFSQVGKDCAACHQDAHRGELGNRCGECHSTVSFVDRTRLVDLHRTSQFQLTGMHAALDCSACHQATAQGRPAFKGLSVECVSCHLEDYRATTNPNHSESGFPTDCTSCHSVRGWTMTAFDHSKTAFPLTGAHRAVLCSDCHVGERFKGTPTACFSCHQDNYNATANPPHASSGFSTQCQTCHTTTNWNASFDHARTSFPLTGAHRPLNCTACHSDGVYNGKPTDCYSCHRQDYEATTNPNHLSLGFSTNCTQCHNTNGWGGANFDHDTNFFPIYSGKHRGKWTSCSDCHTNPNNYQQFTCLSCHPHSDRNKTSNQHREVSGFQYESGACYRCHPRGRAED
jgi:hypothetical protein